jgi:hypothetical protein
MLCIADYTGDDTGTAWAYIDTLADRAECSRRSVQEHLDRLEEAGEIEIYRNAGPKGSHRYRIIFRKSGEEIQPTGRGAEFAPRTDEQVQTAAKGCKSAPPKQHERGANQRRSVAPKTILKGIRREERESAPARIPAEFSEEDFCDTIEFVTALRPGWDTAFSAKERSAFAANADALRSITAEGRAAIRRFLAARLPQGHGYWQPKTRSQFLTDSSDVLTHALDWESKQAKPAARNKADPIQTPEEKAQAERDLAEWLAVQKHATA